MFTGGLKYFILQTGIYLAFQIFKCYRVIESSSCDYINQALHSVSSFGFRVL